jgi:hypothetical protein
LKDKKESPTENVSSFDKDRFIGDVIRSLEKHGLARYHPNLKELDYVIASWVKEPDIEKDWPDDLHPADVLDKYVFPALRERLNG